MSGEIAAVLSSVCYALSYMLLHKAQSESTTDRVDNGLFGILFVGGIALSVALTAQIFTRRGPLVESDDWIVGVSFCILSGLAGTLLGRLALFAAIARIGATRGVIINALAPVVTLIIAVALLDESFEWLAMIGMAVLACGIVLMLLERVWFKQRFIPKWFNQGITIAILATLFQGIGYTLRKVGIETSMTPVFAASLDVVAALIVYLAILAGLGRLRHVLRLFLRQLNLVIIAAGLLTATAIVLFFAATARIPVSQVSMITATQPVIVALLSALFMNKLERLTYITVASSILVTIGVIFIGS